MALIRYNYNSQTLGHFVDIFIAIPAGSLTHFGAGSKGADKVDPVANKNARVPYSPDMKFQTLYLIHGGGDDGETPFRYIPVEEIADKNKIMIVSPSIPNSFGVDSPYGVKYFSFITEELPVVMEGLFHASPKREDRFVAGYAMGGNVALGMGIKRPDLFTTCIDFSGGIGMTLSTETMVDELKSEHFRNFFPRYNASFGTPESYPGSPFDLYPIAVKNKQEGVQLPDYYVVCGSKEFIRARVEKDAQILKDLDYPVKYILAEGYDHNYEMWRKYLDLAVSEWLPIKKEIL